MDIRWINENCGNCLFKINNKCRRNPPSLIYGEKHCDGGIVIEHNEYVYPEVVNTTLACGNWVEK